MPNAMISCFIMIGINPYNCDVSYQCYKSVPKPVDSAISGQWNWWWLTWKWYRYDRWSFPRDRLKKLAWFEHSCCNKYQFPIEIVKKIDPVYKNSDSSCANFFKGSLAFRSFIPYCFWCTLESVLHFSMYSIKLDKTCSARSPEGPLVSSNPKTSSITIITRITLPHHFPTSDLDFGHISTFWTIFWTRFQRKSL